MYNHLQPIADLSAGRFTRSQVAILYVVHPTLHALLVDFESSESAYVTLICYSHDHPILFKLLATQILLTRNCQEKDP